MVLVLVFGAMFFTIISSFVGYIVIQNKLINQKVDLQLAGDIAESGLNYYKWYLAHFPDDVTDGTGLPGPYVHTYYDPEGAAIGEFSLEVASSTYCGEVSSIEVTSTGHTYQAPDVKRTIVAQYSRPSVAEYAYIINSDVWAGSDRVIMGPYHSNGGIRMDGTNNSVVTSGQTTWTCTSSFGCSPSQTVDGVFTTTGNANASLFSFPSAPINFTGLTVDLASMKNKAQSANGIFIPKSTDYGYQVVFNGDDTVTVNRVTGTYQYWGYNSTDGWEYERNVITNTVAYNTYNIDPECPLIYVQDKVWLEGSVSGKVTVAAADITSSSIDPSIILPNHITYTSASTSGLLAIAEHSVLLGLNTPDDMNLNGIFVAQNGRFGRNHYCDSCWSWGDKGLPGYLDAYEFRNSLTLNGTIVSNGRVGTKWTSGGVPASGFLNRYNSYDRNLVDDPPPLIPRTSDVSEVTNWHDER